MVGRHKNRWLRRWLVVIVFWAVPVAIVAVREIQEEMAYNRVDLNNALTTWQLTDAQRAAGAAARCHGTPDVAREAVALPCQCAALELGRMRDRIDGRMERTPVLLRVRGQRCVFAHVRRIVTQYRCLKRRIAG